MLYRAVVAVAVLCLSGASAFTLAPAGALTVNTASAARVEEITMGRGDKRTAKGKRKAKSHRVYRPRPQRAAQAQGCVQCGQRGVNCCSHDVPSA